MKYHELQLTGPITRSHYMLDALTRDYRHILLLHPLSPSRLTQVLSDRTSAKCTPDSPLPSTATGSHLDRACKAMCASRSYFPITTLVPSDLAMQRSHLPHSWLRLPLSLDRSFLVFVWCAFSKASKSRACLRTPVAASSVSNYGRAFHAKFVVESRFPLLCQTIVPSFTLDNDCAF